MKFVYLLTIFLLPSAQAGEIISQKEINDAEAPIFWQLSKTVSVKEGVELPLLFEFSARGNGSVKIKHGQWIKVYDCHEDSYVYDPCLMSQNLKDINGDGFIDVQFSTNLIDPGEKESDPRVNQGQLYVELLYDVSKNSFKLGKHSEFIQPYEYYEE
jgi:hypothetical protein